jgi:hypothetical protein
VLEFPVLVSVHWCTWTCVPDMLLVDLQKQLQHCQASGAGNVLHSLELFNMPSEAATVAVKIVGIEHSNLNAVRYDVQQRLFLVMPSHSEAAAACCRCSILPQPLPLQPTRCNQLHVPTPCTYTPACIRHMRGAHSADSTVHLRPILT